MINILKEKSLSRILEHMRNHDTGFITAYRSEFSHKENQQRNRSLLAKLQSKRYGVISVEGGYIENYGSSEQQAVGEHTFFVIDLDNKGRLQEDLKNLGKEFDQDSILFVPQGGEEGYVWGTSPRKNYEPGFGKYFKLGNPVFGKSGEFFTKVQNRPFIFESIKFEYELPDGWVSRMTCKKISEKNWKEI